MHHKTRVRDFIETMLGRWSGVFNTPADGRVSLQGWLTESDVSLTPEGRLEVDGNLLSPLALADFSPAIDGRPRHQWLFEVASGNRGQ